MDELRRLEALKAYEILDTAPEAAFDRLTAVAAGLFETPVSLVSLIDETRQWFKSCRGLAVTETPRDMAFATTPSVPTTFWSFPTLPVIPASVPTRWSSANPISGSMRGTAAHARRSAGHPVRHRFQAAPPVAGKYPAACLVGPGRRRRSRTARGSGAARPGDRTAQAGGGGGRRHRTAFSRPDRSLRGLVLGNGRRPPLQLRLAKLPRVRAQSRMPARPCSLGGGDTRSRRRCGTMGRSQGVAGPAAAVPQLRIPGGSASCRRQRRPDDR